MDDDEKIFGPLTFRQFVYAAAGIGAIYLAYNNLAQKVSIPLAIVVAVVTFILIRQAAPAPFNEEYIRIKKSKLTKEEFEKWCQRKIAMIQAQIYVREQKGMPADPSFEKVKKILEAALL